MRFADIGADLTKKLEEVSGSLARISNIATQAATDADEATSMLQEIDMSVATIESDVREVLGQATLEAVY